MPDDPLHARIVAEERTTATGKFAERGFTRSEMRAIESNRETFDAIASVRAEATRLGVPMSDLAVAWLLHQPNVTSVLTGIRRPEQASANARAAQLELGADSLERLARATEPVKQALGSNPDLWQSGESSRYR